MAQARAVVRGDREILANMRRTRSAMGGRWLDHVLRGSLEPMKEQTEANARSLRNYVGKYSSFFPQPGPRRGGHLDQGVVIARRETRGLYGRVYWLTFSKRARKLAHLVEFGTMPHYQPNLRGGFHHPGASPKPFASPAFEARKDETVRLVSLATWARIRGSLIGSIR